MFSNKLEELGIVKLIAILLKKDFKRAKNEPTLYVRNQGESNILIVDLYVDDFIFTGNCKEMVEEF